MTELLRVEVTKTAARQIREAATWWEANRPSAPGAVAEDIQRAFQLLATQPSVGARALNARLKGVRRIHLPRIRHHLYYRFGPLGDVPFAVELGGSPGRGLSDFAVRFHS